MLVCLLPFTAQSKTTFEDRRPSGGGDGALPKNWGRRKEQGIEGKASKGSLLLLLLVYGRDKAMSPEREVAVDWDKGKRRRRT